ncbi:MAG: glycosyltransferase family 1 protein [Patescibacteria group bacterium]
MRIGIDARFFGGEQSKGLGRYTEKLLKYLLPLDHTNQYFIFVPEELVEAWPYPQKNVTVIAAPYRWYSLAEQILLPLKLRRYKLDLVHFPHFNVPLLYNRPFIVTIHDLIISRFPTERATTLGPLMYKIKQLGYHSVISHAARAAQHIITVSEYSKRDLIDYFSLPKNKITVLYEAVDKLEAKAIALKRYNINWPYLLYVGNAYPHKNLEQLVSVMQQLKKQGSKLHCVLVGKGDYFYDRLKQLAWAKDVDDVMHFVGFVPDAHLPSLYRAAAVYVFPSRYEGFGLPPLEAMQYGTPVVSARSSCLPEVLGDAAVYFEPDDISGILRGIQILTQDEAVRADYIARGYRQVRRYDWQIMAKQTLALYEKVYTKNIQLNT